MKNKGHRLHGVLTGAHTLGLGAAGAIPSFINHEGRNFTSEDAWKSQSPQS